MAKIIYPTAAEDEAIERALEEDRSRRAGLRAASRVLLASRDASVAGPLLDEVVDPPTGNSTTAATVCGNPAGVTFVEERSAAVADQGFSRRFVEHESHA